MGWNDAYWQNKESRKVDAKRHHEKMVQDRLWEIKDSVRNTKIYSQVVDDVDTYTNKPENYVVNMDTVSAVLEYGTDSDKTVVLNFASFKNPGGGFLDGSSAQEEALCMESTLYEVLSDPDLADYYTYNNKHKNRALYENRALLSPGVVFERGDVIKQASVLTVAAPNRKAYMEYMCDATESDNLEALRDRVKFVTDILNTNQVEVAILGAFGCGVFGQDPTVVAQLFKDNLRTSAVKKVIYAVIDKGGHSKEGAYAIFQRVITG